MRLCHFFLKTDFFSQAVFLPKISSAPKNFAASRRNSSKNKFLSKKRLKKIFSFVWNAFQPWHDEVFFYFCMEDRQVWESVFGRCYETNDDFEKDLFNNVSNKLQIKSELLISQIN